jgi:hypothetical protein
MNLQAQATAMLQAASEFKQCTRNKSGTLNGNSLHAVKRRLADKLVASGEDRTEAWNLAHDLGRQYN